MYFDYHRVAKKLIREGRLTEIRRVERWGKISPAFVLFFVGHRPMPIREERMPEYAALIEEISSSHLIRRGDTEE